MDGQAEFTPGMLVIYRPKRNIAKLGIVTQPDQVGIKWVILEGGCHRVLARTPWVAEYHRTPGEMRALRNDGRWSGEDVLTLALGLGAIILTGTGIALLLDLAYHL